MARPKDTSNEIEEIAAKFAKIHGAPKYIERPSGSLTSREYAKINGISTKTAAEFLLKLYRNKQAERIKIGNTFYYKLIK